MRSPTWFIDLLKLLGTTLWLIVVALTLQSYSRTAKPQTPAQTCPDARNK